MHNYTLELDALGRFPSIAKTAAASAREDEALHYYFGLDVELHALAVCCSVSGGNPKSLGKHGRELFLALAGELIAAGHRVSVVQEACGFGPYLHRDLLALGASSYVVAPENLGGRRKTDKVDARKLAQTLYDREVHGNQEKFRVVRDLGEPARRRRALSRQREQLQKVRGQLSGNGRGLLYDFGHYEVPEGWWGRRKWPKLRERLEAGQRGWLVGMLAPVRETILELHDQIRALGKRLEEGREEDRLEGALAKGLGELTMDVLDVEVGDWGRFNNRGQVGSYTGLCSSERTSSSKRRQGSIDRQGNARIRRQLVEAVWRLKQWNPGWRGFKKFPHVFGAGARIGPATKKKAVVACARMLMIDLWRLRTGQTTLENLGLEAAEPAPPTPPPQTAMD